MAARIKPEIAWQIVDGEAVVIDLGSGQTIGLNPAGTFIWSKLAAGEDVDLATAVASEFDIPIEQASADLDDFLRTLRERRVLQ